MVMCQRRQYSAVDLEKKGRWKFSASSIPRHSAAPMVTSMPPVKSAYSVTAYTAIRARTYTPWYSSGLPDRVRTTAMRRSATTSFLKKPHSILCSPKAAWAVFHRCSASREGASAS